MRSYLAQRRHVVKCIKGTSKEVTVLYGVPQGSILGPVLFMIYVIDLLYTTDRVPITNHRFIVQHLILYIYEQT